jgi:PAS domain S-box-containing protein
LIIPIQINHDAVHRKSSIFCQLFVIYEALKVVCTGLNGTAGELSSKEEECPMSRRLSLFTPLARLRAGIVAVGPFLLLFMLAIAIFPRLAASAGNAATEPSKVSVGSELEFPPYAFIDDRGVAAGFSVDLIHAVADVMGLSLTISTDSWDTVWNDLAAGRLDVLPIVAKVPERTGLVDFSLPHTETFDAFFLRKGDFPLPNIEAARGKEIIVMRSDAAHHELLENGFQGRLILVDTIPEGLSLIATGKYDAFLCSKLIGTMAIQKHGLKGVIAGPPIPDYKRVFSFAVKKGDVELLEKLNQGLLIIKANGQYDQIYEKWLTADGPWWKLKKYLLPVGIIVLAAAVAVGLWVVMLHLLVNKRTRELAETNAMLSQASEKDEERVAQRTMELTHANRALQIEISERKQTEEALRESEERLKRAQEIAHLGSWELDIVNNVLTWSDEVYRICGLQPQEFGATYQAFLDAVHPDDRSAVDEAYAGSLRDGRDTYEIEHRIVRKPAGEIRYVHEKCEHFRDAAGRIIRSTGMVHDITERKQAEAALRESEERFRALVESASQAVWETGADGVVVTDSPSWRAYTGQSVGDWLGSGWVDAVHPDDREDALSQWGQAVATGHNVNAEFRLRGPDGEWRWTNVRAAPIHDTAGKILKWVGMNLDITERKRVEKALNEARAAAEDANRAKSEFLANMSHEIRTPMNGIIGMTELTLDTSLSRHQREYLEMVLSSAESLLKVINDILDFSKIEAGLLEFETAEFDLRDLVEKTAHTLAVRAHQKKLELTCRLDPSLPVTLMGDAGRLRQVLINLIGNAVKFTERGEIMVLVEAMAVESTGKCRLRFAVSDSGIGIPADKMDLLFRQFSQVDSSAARHFGGTGLGLAISRQIVEGMGGTIRAESVEGEGSTFSFVLSLGLSPQQAPDRAMSPQPDMAGMRVLIIDDNQTNRFILTEMLANWGMAPTAVAGGREGIERIRSAATAGEPFRLLLLDERMPEMDGFAVAEQIRGDATLPEMTVMMLTSDDVPAAAARCRQAGIATYMIKPVQQSRLFDSIMETFGRQALCQQETAQTPADHSSPPSDATCILLVEDNRINQVLARTLLEKRGWTVRTAGDGAEAVSVWRQGGIDLILMDVQMPEVDGFQATRRIREQENELGGHIPIIGLTAHAMKGDREECLDAGMDDYIPKPVRAEVLYAAVERLLPGREGAPAIDLSDALCAVNGDRGMLADLAGQFANDYPASRENLQAALERQDFQQLEWIAHSLKSVVGIFGAKNAVKLLQKLEDVAEIEGLQEAKELLPQVLLEMKKVQRSLAVFTAEAAVPPAGPER